MHPDYLGFWYHLNDHSSASTLGILMRISHNQNMICIFVVFEAQLLAILLAKDPVAPRFYFFDQISKISKKKSMCTMQNRAFRMSEISLAWSTSLREFKTFLNLGGPAGSLGHPDGSPRAEKVLCT